MVVRIFYFGSRFPFESHQVRIVLYRECDARGRRLLFDSSAIQKSPMTADSTEQMTTTKNCSSNDSMNTNKPFKNKTKTYSKYEDDCINLSNGFVYKVSVYFDIKIHINIIYIEFFLA